MGRFADFIEARKPQVRKLIDTTYHRLRKRSGLIDQYFPLMSYDDFELLWLRFEDRLPIASLIGFEGEVPNTKAGNIRELQLDVLKLGIAHTWKENDFKLMHKYEQRVTGVPQSFKNQIFGSVQGLVPRIVDLHNVLTWQVIYQGECDYLDPRTGIRGQIEYDTETTLFPAALTGTERWSQPTTANGLQTLVNLTEAFYQVNGYFPDMTVMSRKDYNNLRNQDSVKGAALSKMASSFTSPPTDFTVSLAMLNDLMSDREIPPLYVDDDNRAGFDEQYEIEDAQGNITRGRFLPEGYVTFLTAIKQAANVEGGIDGAEPAATMGERALGPTVENDMQPGIFTLTEEVSKSPPVDRVLAVATGVPAVWDSRTLCAQKIDGAA